MVSVFGQCEEQIMFAIQYPNKKNIPHNIVVISPWCGQSSLDSVNKAFHGMLLALYQRPCCLVQKPPLVVSPNRTSTILSTFRKVPGSLIEPCDIPYPLCTVLNHQFTESLATQTACGHQFFSNIPLQIFRFRAWNRIKQMHQIVWVHQVIFVDANFLQVDDRPC